MKVLIGNSFTYHNDCAGFILEFLENNDISIYAKNDRVGNIDFFKTMYSFNVIHDENFNEDDFDVIIVLSAHDDLLTNIKNNNKYIALLHGVEHYISKNICKYIALCDANALFTKNTVKMIPAYKNIFANNNFELRKKIILYIGPCSDSTYENIKEFVDLVDYEVIIVTRNVLENNYRSPNKKITILKNISMERLQNILRNVSFMLVRQNKFAKNLMSGAIPLAINSNIPLIIQEKNKVLNDKNFKIGFLYKNNYLECVEKINNLSIDEYINMCHNVDEFANGEISKNIKIFNLMIKENIIYDNNNENIIDIIPKKIFQSWHDKSNMPVSVTNSINFIKLSHPDFEHYVYDENECRTFIKENFSYDVLNAYDLLIPKAYKSDLWRYCILYKYGGIYLDSKFISINGFTFNTLLKKQYFARDILDSGRGVCNGLIISKSNNNLMMTLIENVIYNVNNKIYGESPLYPTGPMMIKNYFTDDSIRNMEISLYITDNTYFCHNGKKILKMIDNYKNENKIEESYYCKWKKRCIYK